MTTLRDKRSMHLSATTIWRERAPTSPQIANLGMPKMAIDFSHQRPVVPNRMGQTTRYGENDGHFRPMNSSGQPFALDVMVGGSPDVRARGMQQSRSQQLSLKKGR